ncbi:MAG: dTDP-4-keto-6-deoxy-D-glucose epimerase [Ruminococcaceae bacterium]|nr:dTDP-4-keto-6-deoxy-D-glucose epimerase [Oscillospiraceae bacterium]
MIFKETNIQGLFVVEGKRFEDIRGELIKPYAASFMPENLNLDFKEVWFTKSKKNVIRGMHLQIQPYACEKVISVIDGCVKDVILDLRNGSDTYGQTYDIVLSSDEIKSLYIPTGCAHGYKVISERSIVMYMGTQPNISSCDIGIHWNSFGYNWEIDSPIISDKDKNLEPFIKGTTKF